MKHIEKLAAIREAMKAQGIDGYIIPSSDPHISEYLPERYKCIAWASGFTGSAGTLAITQDFAGLWTDSRYFVQAAEQLAGTGFELVKLKVQGAAEYADWLGEQLGAGAKVAFDGNLASLLVAQSVQHTLEPLEIKVDGHVDLLSSLWEGRPELPKAQAYLLDENITGQSTVSKIEAVRAEMKKNRTEAHLISSLDDLAWLLNIRGQDVPCNPVFLSYLLMDDNNCTLYLDKEKVNAEISKYLEENGVSVKAYEDVASDVAQLNEKSVVTYDPTKTNVWIKDALKSNVKVVERRNITTDLKARKNEAELKNVENAMTKDGVAMVKFFNWLKKNIGNTEITEITAADKLTQFRSEREGFVDISFSTISGYGPNGAIIHYHATEENHSKLEPKSLYLIDSGAQYLDGTTDITRTLALGELTEEEKVDYTLVLKGNIALSMAKFLYGIAGCNLDILARKPMWDRGIDYKHGTGHGIGYLLNVHEGPQGIRKEISNVTLEEGMLISNEPGIYREGKHGIRLENIIAVAKDVETEFGKFMRFDVLTYCPFELEAIKVELLSCEEKQWLNNYHELVYNKLEAYLNEEERAWLKEATRAI